jgi:hypothetical protein
MNTIFRKLVLGAILAASTVTFGTTTTARADDYWNNHWGWYDNSYRPYYQRHYYRSPYYGNGYRYNGPAPYYGNGYYYNAPRTYYYPGGGAQIGPLRFGWW